MGRKINLERYQYAISLIEREGPLTIVDLCRELQCKYPIINRILIHAEDIGDLLVEDNLGRISRFYLAGMETTVKTAQAQTAQLYTKSESR